MQVGIHWKVVEAALLLITIRFISWEVQSMPSRVEWLPCFGNRVEQQKVPAMTKPASASSVLVPSTTQSSAPP